jgi:hypothetical protein
MAAPGAVAVPERRPDPAGGAVAPCAVCGSPVDGRFCERCGHDSLAPPPAPGPRTGGWLLVATADRGYYEVVRTTAAPQSPPPAFPAEPVVRRYALRGTEVLIGRRLPPGGVDLGPVGDVGVSHRHARLLAQPDGGWVVEDLGSTNGTHLNSLTTALRPHTGAPLRAGDDVYLGAWTRLTLTQEVGT